MPPISCSLHICPIHLPIVPQIVPNFWFFLKKHEMIYWINELQFRVSDTLSSKLIDEIWRAIVVINCDFLVISAIFVSKCKLLFCSRYVLADVRFISYHAFFVSDRMIVCAWLSVRAGIKPIFVYQRNETSDVGSVILHALVTFQQSLITRFGNITLGFKLLCIVDTVP